MAETFKSAPVVVTAITEGAAETVLTVSGSATVMIIGMRVANSDAVSPYNINVFFERDVGSPLTTTKFYLTGKDTQIPLNAALEAQEGKTVLQAGDVLKVYPDTAHKLHFTLSYIEITP